MFGELSGAVGKALCGAGVGETCGALSEAPASSGLNDGGLPAMFFS
jgi:hypothetical protein